MKECMQQHHQCAIAAATDSQSRRKRRKKKKEKRKGQKKGRIKTSALFCPSPAEWEIQERWPKKRGTLSDPQKLPHGPVGRSRWHSCTMPCLTTKNAIPASATTTHWRILPVANK